MQFVARSLPRSFTAAAAARRSLHCAPLSATLASRPSQQASARRIAPVRFALPPPFVNSARPLNSTASHLIRRPMSSAAGGAPSSGAVSTPPPPRGAFILLEGLDRSGKSSQCLKLAEALNTAAAAAAASAGSDGAAGSASASVVAVNMRFPDRTTAIGKMIDEYLRQSKEVDDRAIHLLFSANRWEAVSAMKAALERGQHIICDRYAYSGIAFSRSKLAGPGAAASDDGRALSFEWCCMPDRGLPAPDVVLFLDVSAEDAAKRGSFGEERYEKRDIQDRVRGVFEQLRAQSTAAGSNEDQKAFGQGVAWQVVDAGQSMEAVHAQLMQAAQQTIERVTKENAPIKLL